MNGVRLPGARLNGSLAQLAEHPVEARSALVRSQRESRKIMAYKHCGDVPLFQSGEQGSIPWWASYALQAQADVLLTLNPLNS
jgi:hypothetical protein